MRRYASGVIERRYYSARHRSRRRQGSPTSQTADNTCGTFRGMTFALVP